MNANKPSSLRTVAVGQSRFRVEPSLQNPFLVDSLRHSASPPLALCLPCSMVAATRSDFSPPQFNGQPMQLVQLHVFFRHGDRSPIQSVPNTRADPWSERLQEVPALMAPRSYRLQERPFGHLTRKGAEQTRALGQWIRDAYLKELDVNRQDPSSFVRVRSTNFLRCHLSAWFVLEGLLGSSEAAASVNVSILEDREENLYDNDHCQRLAKKWREAWTKSTPIEVLPDGSVEEGGGYTRFQSIRLHLCKQWSIPLNKRFPWPMVLDYAHCAVSHGDPLPEDLAEDKVAEIRSLLAKNYVNTFKDKEICTLSMGRLLSEVVHAMKQSSGTCIYLYAGHDATLVPLSVSLGVPWKDLPVYASSICIELWRPLPLDEHGQLFVRILYDGREVALPVDLPGIEHTWQEQPQDKGSKSLVTLDEFVKLAGWSMLTQAEYEMNWFMGGVFSCRGDGNHHSDMSAQDLAYYTELYPVPAREVLILYERFKAMCKDGSDTIQEKDLENIEEMQGNPFASRIMELFSEDGSGCLNFEKFMNMVTAFSEDSPLEMRFIWAFAIWDFDGDDVIGDEDIKQGISMITQTEDSLSAPVHIFHGPRATVTLKEAEIDELVARVQQEIDPDNYGLSYSDFRRVLLRMPDFLNNFRMNFVT